MPRQLMMDRAIALLRNAGTECVQWPGSRDRWGYGRLTTAGPGTTCAHRLVYERLIGPVPAGMQLDHLCHTRDSSCPGGNGCAHRACINPVHLEPVTPQQNQRRIAGTDDECPAGHPRETNTYVSSYDGGARCRECNRLTATRYRARKRLAMVGAS